MLKPDYLDLDKDGNKTEPMKEAVKDRDMRAMGGLLEDDREQYVVGGISRAASKLLSKATSKLKGKSSKAKPTQKELEDELRQLEYEQQQLMEDNINTPEGLVGARLDASEEISDLADDVMKDLKKYYPDSKLLKRTEKAEGGSMDDQMLMIMTPPQESEMESDDDMEDGYTRFIMEEALSEEEEDMLTSKLEQDEELSMLFDKIIDVAQEFAGSGPVNGPGSGVSDSIPARLSDGEFVFTAKAVEEIGEDALMSMMKEAEAAADERQMANVGGVIREEKEIMAVEKEPVEQNINVTKTTVDSQAGMLSQQEDLVGKAVKENMMLDPYQRHVRS
jgi:hypothetical protein